MKSRHRKGKGFTLVELVVVLAITEIILAMGIRSLMNALQRAKQKRSMADMRGIATAIESYAIDYRNYPPAAMLSVPVLYGGISYPSKTLGITKMYVAPTYLKVIPLAGGLESLVPFNTSG